MKIKSDKIEALVKQIEAILDELNKVALTYEDQITQIHPSFQKSARNLIHYRTLRTIDITGLQKDLGDIGLTRLARAEPHIAGSLNNARFLLKTLMHESYSKGKERTISLKKAKKVLMTHTKDLLGYRSSGRRVRIMVTLPSEAAHNYALVHNLIESGMNTARINCAHDGPNEWLKMIEHVANAKTKLNKNCRIAMDLAGPKIRTGAIEPGPQVKKFKPKRDALGQVIMPAEIVLVKVMGAQNTNQLPVEETWFNSLETGDSISFKDTRGKKRHLLVQAVDANKIVTFSSKTSYLTTGSKLTTIGSAKSGLVGPLPALEQALLLKNGEILNIVKDQIPGKSTQYSERGDLVEEAFVSCTSPEVFNFVKVGERILFDDGKIEGKIQQVTENRIKVQIVHAKENGSTLKADKGINFPDTDLGISGLTNKDREDLKFVAKYADVVNFSFVNSPEDVAELHRELKQLDVYGKLGIILKIETQKAYDNLTAIMLEGMKSYPLGVMIARGDLAVESGWENMARIQQEIMSLCNAAHVPDVWATQVFENLAKTGVPSRSEITDAATALNAECVMLNKGPYIQKAVKLLDHMLKSLNGYRDKNVRMLPAMEKANTLSKFFQNEIDQ